MMPDGSSNLGNGASAADPDPMLSGFSAPERGIVYEITVRK